MQGDGSFGHWLRQRRQALDLTQADLAAQIHCSPITIRKIECDERQPSKQIADHLADVLAIEPQERAAFIHFARQVKVQPAALPIDLTATEQVGPLPQPITPFVGRERELAYVSDHLADPGCRLLTLVGPGGIGKTRLALEAVQHLHFPNGSYFVSLAPVNSAEALVSALGAALGVQFNGQDPAAVQLFNFLREKSLLLVLDNFEHLLAGTPLILDLLADAPRLKFLITSRERLNLQSEWVFQQGNCI